MNHPRKIAVHPRFVLLLGLATVLVIGLSACGSFGGKATVTLHVSNGGTPSVVITSVVPTTVTAQAFVTPQASGELAQSFTPTALDVPVLGIYLRDSATNAATQIYSCDPTSDPNGCRVDLVNNLSGFQDVINSTAQAAAGTYDTITVQNCTNGKGGSATSNPIDYTADVTGEATINGTRYYTDPTQPGLVSPGSAAAQAVSVGFSGCASDYALPSPIVLADGDAFTLSLYIDLAGIAWIDNGVWNLSWMPSGCARDPSASTPTAPSAPFVCLSYPDVGAAPGDLPPTLKRYLVVDGTTVPTALQSGAVFGIYYDANGNPLSGYTRPFYEQTVVQLGFQPATPFASLAANADGTTLTVKSFGSTSSGPGYFESGDFPIDGNAAGTYTTSDPGQTVCTSGGPCDFAASVNPY